jgi:hypothetical protein
MGYLAVQLAFLFLLIHDIQSISWATAKDSNTLLIFDNEHEIQSRFIQDG